jgi:uncharacterized protein YndB with AHSA1/START domain
MAEYAFLSTWLLRGVTREDVFATLRDSAGYPGWWHGVRSADVRSRGRDDGVGDVVAFAWRSVLPYTLTFELELTAIEPPYRIAAAARGELEGTGTWRVYDGPEIAVVYEWRVATTKAWMNALGPLARPAFVWNHDLVMRRGAGGLARRLGGSVVVTD